MATFNQHNQQVQYQYNADTINFGAVSTAQDCSAMVNTLLGEAQKAIEAKAVQGEDAIDLESHLKKAVLNAEDPKANKQNLIDRLKKAKELVSGTTGLAAAIGTAITTIGGLF